MKTEEKIPGGLGKNLKGSMKQQHKQIATMHGVDVSKIDSEVSKGIKIEMEHTTDKDIAHEIAMDHVIEDPEYYTKLSKTELEERKKKAGTESSKENNLRDWFKRKGAKGKKGGWVDCNSPDGKGGYKACGREEGEKRKKYPACRPTPGACKERGKGKSWGKKAKRNESMKITNEELKKIILEELESVLEEEGKKDACYHKVKSRYDVWPSAYASGALSKCRKVGAENWGNSTKEGLISEQNDLMSDNGYGSPGYESFLISPRFIKQKNMMPGDPDYLANIVVQGLRGDRNDPDNARRMRELALEAVLNLFDIVLAEEPHPQITTNPKSKEQIIEFLDFALQELQN